MRLDLKCMLKKLWFESYFNCSLSLTVFFFVFFLAIIVFRNDSRTKVCSSMSWFFEKIEIQAGMRKVQKRTLSFLPTNY